MAIKLRAFMSDSQSGKPHKKPFSPGKIVLTGAGATGLAVFNIASNSEAPSQALALLQYVMLALGLIGLAGGLFMIATASK